VRFARRTQLKAVLNAVSRTDWAAMPGHETVFMPEVIAPALRALVSASSEAEAVTAASPLAGGGLYHDHSGYLHPAALAAAPILLDIAEFCPDAVFPVIEALFVGFLHNSCPWDLAPYAPGSAGEARLLCCAIADVVRARSAMLARRGRPGVDLVRSANTHWSFTVAEVAEAERPGNLLGFGHLIGAPRRSYARCELRRPQLPVTPLSARVNVLYPPADGDDGEALLRFHFIEPAQLRVGDVLASPCHDFLFY
jgi:hypothetical protein